MINWENKFVDKRSKFTGNEILPNSIRIGQTFDSCGTKTQKTSDRVNYTQTAGRQSSRWC